MHFLKTNQPTQTVRSGQSPLVQSKEKEDLWQQQRESSEKTASEALPTIAHDFSRIPVFPSPTAYIQPKLIINQPGDQYEQEADQMAEQVMRMQEWSRPVNPIINRPVNAIQRQCADCEKEENDEEEGTLMRKAENGGGFQASPGLTSQLEATRGGGFPLPGPTRGFMERAFQTDFSGVRLHTDGRAAEMSQGIQARAFTSGSDIYFNNGNYNPHSAEGRFLLAHELTHTIHQRGASTQMVFRSVDDWLTSNVNVNAWTYTELLGEIDELSQWLQRQITTSEETTRIEEALTILRREAAQRERSAEAPRRPRRSRREATGQSAQTSQSLHRPRILDRRSSFQYTDPSEMRAEFDLIMQWLARDDISAADRQILTTERNNLSPMLQQDRQRIGTERQSARIQIALTGNELAAADSLARVARAIQGIVPDSDNPDLHYLYDNNERIPISREQAETLRDTLVDQLQRVHTQILLRNSYYWDRYNSQLAINRDSPIIAGISGWLGNVRNPYLELSQRYFSSRGRLQNLEAQIRSSRFVEAATLIPQLERVGQEIRGLSMAFYEGHIEGAEMAVGILEFTRDASFTIAASIAAVVAAPFVAGAVATTGATGFTAGALTTIGTGTLVGTGTALTRGASTASGHLLAGNSWLQAGEAFREEAVRGFREGFMAGAAGAASRVLGPALGVGAEVSNQILRRMAAEAIINGTSTMIDSLWQSCSNNRCNSAAVTEAVAAGLRSALLSVPGAVVGGSNNPLVRELGGPLTAGASAYVEAVASGASVQEAMRAAGVAVTTSIAMNRASHGSGVDAGLETRGNRFGEAIQAGFNTSSPRTSGSPSSNLLSTSDIVPNQHSRVDTNLDVNSSNQPAPILDSDSVALLSEDTSPSLTHPDGTPIPASDAPTNTALLLPAEAPPSIIHPEATPTPASDAPTNPMLLLPVEATTLGNHPEPASQSTDSPTHQSSETTSSEPFSAQQRTLQEISNEQSTRRAHIADQIHPLNLRIEGLTQRIETLSREISSFRGAARQRHVERIRSSEATLRSLEAQREPLLRQRRAIDREISRTRLLQNPEQRTAMPCFSAETLISTKAGKKPINQVKVGDIIFSYDFDSEQITERRILEVHVNKTTHFYHIYVGQHCIQATGQHPFWEPSQSQWISANQLTVGMELLHIDNTKRLIEQVELYEFDEAPSYNLTIEETPFYFVGNGILVHNQDPVRYEFGNYSIYLGTHPGFPDFVYIGQTEGSIRNRQNEHRQEAVSRLRDQTISAREREFFLFKQRMECRAIVSGLNAEMANYFEQLNITYESRIRGRKNVTNRREQVALTREQSLLLRVIEMARERDPRFCPR